MKTTIKNAILGLALVLSVQGFSQTDFTIKNPIMVDNHGEAPAEFRVKIYPNPSLTGNVKMEWPDWAEVEMIQLNNISTNEVRSVDVEKGTRKIMISGIEEGVYAVKFIRQSSILGTKKLKVIG